MCTRLQVQSQSYVMASIFSMKQQMRVRQVGRCQEKRLEEEASVRNERERQSTDHKHRIIANSVGQLETITWNFGLSISSTVQFFSLILSCLNEKEAGSQVFIKFGFCQWMRMKNNGNKFEDYGKRVVEVSTQIGMELNVGTGSQIKRMLNNYQEGSKKHRRNKENKQNTKIEQQT